MKAGDKVIIVSTNEIGTIRNIEGNIFNIILDNPTPLYGNLYTTLRITSNKHNLKLI